MKTTGHPATESPLRIPHSAFRTSHPALAFIALGSNLGDSRQIVLDAMGHLEKFSNRPIFKSSLWQTSPVDCPPGSTPFVNAVVAMVPFADETPESLLKRLRHLEKKSGRVPKKVLNEPRALDLDLIAFGAETRNTPELVLPHPRAHLRRFVLQPLSEIAPDLVLPGQSQTVSRLLAGLPPDETVTRLPNKTTIPPA
jgi:2-amino-4-hydroxy-6-hydroxymethyldihydropteridine diphosphokinase